MGVFLFRIGDDSFIEFKGLPDLWWLTKVDPTRHTTLAIPLELTASWFLQSPYLYLIAVAFSVLATKVPNGYRTQLLSDPRPDARPGKRRGR